MQVTTGTLVYADVGPLSNKRSRHLESVLTVSLDCDEHRVEYAQLNHKAPNYKPVSSADKSAAKEGNILITSVDRQIDIPLKGHF